ncbi:hypothetical protein LIER_39007 [Lithospermum erythrorhizon]|uniref:Cystatin domain-containing protein n=1 Tax=Lithospermum erythrorhizon TaxID=34254 RepID=A0AAV3Q866_LITER
MAKSTLPCTLSPLLLTILITLLSFHVNGQVTNIPNVQTNPEVQDIGKSSIDQYNTREVPKNPAKNLPLTFKQVVEASVETVSGFKKYTLKINTAFQDGTAVSFDCVSALNPGEKTAALVSWGLKTI